MLSKVLVFKDAYAAIYGVESANGVILITAKRGKNDSPATVNYSFYEGLLAPTSLPEMAVAGQYSEMIREMISILGRARMSNATLPSIGGTEGTHGSGPPGSRYPNFSTKKNKPNTNRKNSKRHTGKEQQ